MTARPIGNSGMRRAINLLTLVDSVTIAANPLEAV